MICKKCGAEIDSVEVDMFNEDGSDDWYDVGVFEEYGVVYINLPEEWTGNGLSEEEQVETIRCPHCKKYLFADRVIDTVHMIGMTVFPEEDGV